MNELFSLWGPHRCWRRMKECKGRCDDEYVSAMMECAAVRVLIDYKKCTEVVVVVPRVISRAFVFSLFFQRDLKYVVFDWLAIGWDMEHESEHGYLSLLVMAESVRVLASMKPCPLPISICV